MKYYPFLATLISSIFFSSVLYAQDDRREVSGRFEVVTTSAEILGKEAAEAYKQELDPNDKIKWTYYIPKGYDPAIPPGIMVHVTQNNLAKIPFGWQSVMDEKNLIWISLNKAGRLVRSKEVLLTVLTTPFLQDKYSVNVDRIYTVSQTDSCYSASAAMQVYPDIFKGAIYSTCQPLNWRKDIPSTIDQMRKNRYVFISSSERDIKQIMRRSVRQYIEDGLDKTEYMYIPKLKYGRNPDRRKFRQAVDFLDTRD
ncbi:MAG: hypothetical protein P8J14_11740 [Emcibacteraceae bacterium]|nr:hypothetical protein [Emcibacteraceae bacterium]